MGVQIEAEQADFSQMEDVNFTDSDLVFHVRNALKAVSLGDSDSYNQLVGMLHFKENLSPDEVALLVTSLKALSGAVSCIDIIHHHSLLSSIFGMSLWNYGPDVMDALIELIISLAGSSGVYVDLCLDMLVSNFMPPYTFIDSLNLQRGFTRKFQVLNRVHEALKHISHLVPLAPKRLADIVTQRMPNIFTKEQFIILYVENMLKLESSTMGELIGSIMIIAVMDRLIDLDVDIGWDDILQEDTCKGIFEMELEDIGEQGDEYGDELFMDSSIHNGIRGNVVAEKLDSLMVLTFEHLKSCKDNSRFVKVFETLLLSFEITVLKAYKSKFAQFVMFYACSLDPEYCGVRFAEILVDWFTRSSDPLTRMSAVSYLASYLVRAKFLSASLIATILSRLIKWCDEYCKIHDGDVNPKAHRVFYSACQAIMYVLCFRLRTLLCVPHLKSHLLRMPIESILKHPLSPLKVCLPSIVEEFLRQARAVHLFTVSETYLNNNLLESELSIAFGGMERLDVFFPFDPCLLKKSDRFIRPNFVYWSMVRTTYNNGEEDDGSSSDEENARVCAYGNDSFNQTTSERYEDDLNEFQDSLHKMSITPKDSLNYMFGGNLKRMPSRIRPSTSPESL